MARGRFITLEGIEGVGKSSHVGALARALAHGGREPLVTREPGGTPVADRIRAILLDPDAAAPAPDTELMLVFAARCEHLEARVRPALARGQWVVCDRFTDATYAYQGGGRGIAAERIAALEDWVQGALRPDRTVLLDAPVETALGRARGRAPTDRFERETASFFERVRAVYLERAAAEPQRFRVIDADRPIEAVRADVVAAIGDLTETGDDDD